MIYIPFSSQLLCIIVNDEASVAAFKDFTGDESEAAAAPEAAPEPVAAAPAVPAATPTAAPAAVTAPAATGRVFASPLAKTLAAEKGINLTVSCYFW